MQEKLRRHVFEYRRRQHCCSILFPSICIGSVKVCVQVPFHQKLGPVGASYDVHNDTLNRQGNTSCARSFINRCSRSSSRVIQKKLDEEFPVPYFLADSSHLVKVVAHKIFSIVNDSKVQQYGRTKSDDLRLKTYWGYMINKASEVPLDHMFNNH